MSFEGKFYNLADICAGAKQNNSIDVNSLLPYSESLSVSIHCFFETLYVWHVLLLLQLG